jgi:hypothetical protein
MRPSVGFETPFMELRRQDGVHVQLLGESVVRSPLNALATLPTTDELARRR